MLLAGAAAPSSPLVGPAWWALSGPGLSPIGISGNAYPPAPYPPQPQPGQDPYPPASYPPGIYPPAPRRLSTSALSADRLPTGTAAGLPDIELARLAGVGQPAGRPGRADTACLRQGDDFDWRPLVSFDQSLQIRRGYPVQAFVTLRVSPPAGPASQAIVTHEVRGEWPLGQRIDTVEIRCGEETLASITPVTAAR